MSIMDKLINLLFKSRVKKTTYVWNDILREAVPRTRYVYEVNHRKVGFVVAGAIMMFTTPVVGAVAYNVVRADDNTVVEQTTETTIDTTTTTVYVPQVEETLPEVTVPVVPVVEKPQYVCDVVTDSTNYKFVQLTTSSGKVIVDGIDPEQTKGMYPFVNADNIYFMVEIPVMYGETIGDMMNENMPEWQVFVDAADYLSVALGKNITVGWRDPAEDFVGEVYPIRLDTDERSMFAGDSSDNSAAWNESDFVSFFGSYWAENAMYIRSNFIFSDSWQEQGIRVVLHEFGHALGFEHVYGEDAIMSYDSNPVIKTYLPGDIAGLKALLCGK